MQDKYSFSWVNLQKANPGLKVLTFEDGDEFERVHRVKDYSLIWITEGLGTLKTDFREYQLQKNSLFAFSPQQPFSFSGEKIKGTAIFFDPDFLCIQKEQTETACLFNYEEQLPYTLIDSNSSPLLSRLIDQMKSEMENPAPAQYEVLVSYLKIFLITVSRLKMDQQPDSLAMIPDPGEPFILQQLKNRIEKDFRKKHAAGDYARELNISGK